MIRSALNGPRNLTTMPVFSFLPQDPTSRSTPSVPAFIAICLLGIAAIGSSPAGADSGGRVAQSAVKLSVEFRVSFSVPRSTFDAQTLRSAVLERIESRGLRPDPETMAAVIAELLKVEPLAYIKHLRSRRDLRTVFYRTGTAFRVTGAGRFLTNSEVIVPRRDLLESTVRHSIRLHETPPSRVALRGAFPELIHTKLTADDDRLWSGKDLLSRRLTEAYVNHYLEEARVMERSRKIKIAFSSVGPNNIKEVGWEFARVVRVGTEPHTAALALLEIDDSEVPPLEIPKADPEFRPDEKVCSIGFSLETRSSWVTDRDWLNPDRRCGTVLDSAGNQDRAALIETNIPMPAGVLGSPVVDGRGRFVGMAVGSGKQSPSLAVLPVGSIRSFLARDSGDGP